ncbi:hypothetical protein PUN28_013762 [Cardiocondyla obscurior]|uniref:Uncharacterized protein n=1 Tax=Cardiocondyla obscurior TaxID=286306 RepID=A0AAW2F634_9HYME
MKLLGSVDVASRDYSLSLTETTPGTGKFAPPLKPGCHTGGKGLHVPAIPSVNKTTRPLSNMLFIEEVTTLNNACTVQ